jgi:hypothetical protein
MLDVLPQGQANQGLNPIGSLLGDTWKLYKENFPVLTGIILIPVFIQSLVNVVSIPGFGNLIGSVSITVLMWVLFVTSSAAVIIRIHEQTGFIESYRRSVKLSLYLILLVILNFLAVVGGFVVLIVPGVLISVWLTFSIYAMVIERKRGFNALAQSREYVRGYWWDVFARVIILSVLFSIIFLPLNILAVIFLGTIAKTLVFSLLSLVVIPFFICYTYGIYINLVRLKPNLATDQVVSGKGFLVTSVIIGLIASGAIIYGTYLLIDGNLGLIKREYFLPGFQPPMLDDSFISNQQQYAKEVRDGSRVADLHVIQSALTIFGDYSLVEGKKMSAGLPNKVYVSVPDSSPNCESLGLPPLPGGWSYSCVPASKLMNVDGTGWIPVPFTMIKIGSPIATLVVDPVNTVSSGQYYTYVVGVEPGSYELTALFESQSFREDLLDKDGGKNPTFYEMGTDLNLSPFVRGSSVN